jgi:hypothetical protein
VLHIKEVVAQIRPLDSHGSSPNGTDGIRHLDTDQKPKPWSRICETESVVMHLICADISLLAVVDRMQQQVTVNVMTVAMATRSHLPCGRDSARNFRMRHHYLRSAFSAVAGLEPPLYPPKQVTNANGQVLVSGRSGRSTTLELWLAGWPPTLVIL